MLSVLELGLGLASHFPSRAGERVGQDGQSPEAQNPEGDPVNLKFFSVHIIC